MNDKLKGSFDILPHPPIQIALLARRKASAGPRKEAVSYRAQRFSEYKYDFSNYTTYVCLKS